MSIRDLATRLGPTLTPDPRRVIIKLFVPGEDAALTRSRAAALIDRITLLDEDQTTEMLQETLRRFGNRHHDLETIFAHHHDLVRHRVPRDVDLSLPTASSWAPTSVTSTPWRARRCAIPPWFPIPTSPACAPGNSVWRSACGRSARDTCPRSASPRHCSAPAPSWRSATARERCPSDAGTGSAIDAICSPPGSATAPGTTR